MRPCAFCSFNSSKFFYVSSDDQTNLPLPLSDKVRVYPVPGFEVYVRSVLHFPCCYQVLRAYILYRSFEGNPDLEEFMRQTNILLEDLKEDGISKNDLNLEVFYMTKYENSINEVFLVKKPNV